MFLKMGTDDISFTRTVSTSVSTSSAADISSQEDPLSSTHSASASPIPASTSTPEDNTDNREASGNQPPLPEHSSIPSEDEEMSLVGTTASSTRTINNSPTQPAVSFSSSTAYPTTSSAINALASDRSEALALFSSLLKRSTEEAELLKLTEANTRANSGPPRKKVPRKSSLFPPSPPRSKRSLLEMFDNSGQPPSPCYMADDEEEYDTPEKATISRDLDASSPRKRRRPESSSSPSDLPPIHPTLGGSVGHQNQSPSLPLAQLVADLPKKEIKRWSIKTVRINEELNTILEFEQSASIIPPSHYTKEQRAQDEEEEDQEDQEGQDDQEEEEQVRTSSSARPVFSFLSLSSSATSSSSSSSTSSSSASDCSLPNWPWAPSQATLPMDMDTEPTDRSQDQNALDDPKSNQEQKMPFVMSLTNTSQQVLDFAASLNRLWAPPKLRTSFSDMSFNSSKSRENQPVSPQSPVSTSWSPDPAAFSSPATQITAQPRLPMMRREMSMPSLGAGLEFWSKASTSNNSEKIESWSDESSYSQHKPIHHDPTATSSKSKERGADRPRSREDSLFHPYRRPSPGATPVSSSSPPATETPQISLVDLLQGPSSSLTPRLSRSSSFSGSDRPAPVLKRQASTSAIKEFLQTEPSSTASAAKAT
ncbi:hypothetical protein BG000_010473 [Podila horticola]|nr:hypothetical protein BG000_010473 [Podila horticola]